MPECGVCVCVSVCVCVCVCVKRVSDPEAGVVVSLLMWVPGTKPRSSARSASALNYWAISPASFGVVFVYDWGLFRLSLLRFDTLGSELRKFVLKELAHFLKDVEIRKIKLTLLTVFLCYYHCSLQR